MCFWGNTQQTSPSASEEQHSRQIPAAGALSEWQMSGDCWSCFWSLHKPRRQVQLFHRDLRLLIFPRWWSQPPPTPTYSPMLFCQMLNNPSIRVNCSWSEEQERLIHVYYPELQLLDRVAQTNLTQSVIRRRVYSLFFCLPVRKQQQPQKKSKKSWLHQAEGGEREGET